MPRVDPGLSSDARRQFLHALRRILRPVIRLLIRNGVDFSEFADVARGAYVESAIHNSVNHGAKPTRERIAQITGIPRQRVDHYIDDKDALPSAESTPMGVLAEILHKWHTDPRYLGPYDVPLELEFDSPTGSSFQDLVAEVNVNADPNLALDELLKAKSVLYSDQKSLRVITRCFTWPDGSFHGIEFFGAALAHLVQTHEYNFHPANAENKRLERFVSADQGLPARLLPSFHTFAKDRTNQFLLDIDDWLARFSDTAAPHSGPRVETGISVFLYVDSPPDTGTLSTLVQPARDMAAATGGHAS